MSEMDKSKRIRIGWWVFIGLAALTAVEFWLSTAVRGTLPYLTVTAVLKGALIAVYFMHIAQIWNPDARHK